MLMNVWLAFNIFENVLQNSNDGIKTVVEVGSGSATEVGWQDSLGMGKQHSHPAIPHHRNKKKTGLGMCHLPGN